MENPIIKLNGNKYGIGARVVVGVRERTDSLAHKRHTALDAQKWRSVAVGGEIQEIKDDGYFSMKLSDNNEFEKDGEIYVFHKNDLLTAQDYPNDKLGIWEEY